MPQTIFTSTSTNKRKLEKKKKKKNSLASGSSSGDDVSNYSDESDANDNQGGLVDDFNFGEGDDGSSSESEGQDPWEGNQVLVDYDDKFTDDSSEIFYRVVLLECQI